MIDISTKDHIEAAVYSERDSAIVFHGHFHNNHEAWAVLREEIEELEEAYKQFKSVTASEMENLWVMTRSDHVERENLLNIYDSAIEVASECIQVLAMCDKWRDLLRGAGNV